MILYCNQVNVNFRFFRIIHGPLFIKYFASDRRHMRDSVGNWISEPPSYEAIVAEGILCLYFHFAFQL